MRDISFKPGDFESGASYIAELLFNGVVVQSKTPIANQINTFTVTTPGDYVLVVRKVGEDACIQQFFVAALFPILTHTESEVNCSVNTYTYSITLTNPGTAGTNIEYGWSLSNEKNTVTNWTGGTNFTVPADNVPRYFFARNSSGCIISMGSTQKNPCNICTLTVTNVVFSCG